MKIPTRTELQKLVLELMSPTQPAMSNEEIRNWTGQLPGIRNEMFEVMRFILFGGLSRKIISRHLQQICKECTLMLDVLYNYPDFPERMMPLFKSVVACLQEILLHQQLRYHKYLDPYAPMPIIMYRVAAQKIETQAALMVTIMTRYHADKRLQALIIGKMTGLLKKNSGTWHQIGYLEKLQSSIMCLCMGPVFNVTGQLRNLLQQANFNTSGFLTYCKNEIEDEMAECYELTKQYDCLFRYKMELSLLMDKYRFLRFDLKRFKVRDVLLKYVNLWLSMLNKRYGVVAENKVEVLPGQACKLPISISVDVLAYLFKLLVMAGVTSFPKKDLLFFISRNFQTIGGTGRDISLKSIDNKYRQVVKNTAMGVRSLLLKMLKQLDDDFNSRK